MSSPTLHAPPHLLARNERSSSGTVAVVIFIFGAIILVLMIILLILFVKKRRQASTKTFIPRLERQRGGNYGKLEEDEEGAWSADMGADASHGRQGARGAGDEGKGTYAPVSCGFPLVFDLVLSEVCFCEGLLIVGFPRSMMRVWGTRVRRCRVER